MTLTEQTLTTVGSLSAGLSSAVAADDAQALASLVAACRSVEAAALAALAGRVSQSELLTAQSEALAALGW